MSFYEDFIEYIRHNPMYIDYPVNKGDSFIYRDDKFSDTYLTVKKLRQIGNVDFYEIEYYEVYEETKKELHIKFISHLFTFLDNNSRKRKRPFVLTRNTPNRTLQPINKYGDVIFPTLESKMNRIPDHHSKYIYTDRSGTQYAFVNDDKNVGNLFQELFVVQENIFHSKNAKIIHSITMTEHYQSESMFRHFHFLYKNYRVRVYLTNTNPLSIFIELAEIGSFCPLIINGEEFIDMENSIEEMLELNKLALLMKDMI